MADFLAFRRMLRPWLIQVLFWLAMFASVLGGVVLIGLGARDHRASEALVGVGSLLLGPLVVRVYAELLIVVFRINETLTDLRALAVWTAEREHAYDTDEETVVGG